MSGLMSIGKSAMFANYAALQTVGNNIANANTVGYSRQEAALADKTSQYTGAGFFGKGVDVTTVKRSYDQLLTNQAVASSSTAAADSARLARLSQLEAAFPIGASGVGYAAGEFLNSFVDVSNNPSDSSARQVVLSQAQELASRFRATGDTLSDLQTGVSQDIKAQVASVNSYANQIASLNGEIAQLKGTGQPPNQLLDKRDLLVKQLAGIINVTTIAADDGSLGVFISGGQNLVLANHSNAIQATPDDFDPAKTKLTVSEGGISRNVSTDGLIGGSLSGLLKFQNEDLRAATNLLGQMAVAISGAVNTQQSLGLDLGQPAGAGAPVFSVGAARVLSAADNAGNAALSLTVTDSSQVQASDYAVAFDGTNYTVTRSRDQGVVAGSPFSPAALAAGVQFDGVRLQLTGGTPAVNDRFELQPVGSAAQNMSAVLTNTKGIAAAAPFTGSVGVNNTGTAAVASLTAVSPTYNGALSTAITFTSATGNYSWSMSNGATGTGTWTAGTPITLNGYELKLVGVPKNGDTVSVIPTVSTETNNGNALAFAGLSKTGIVSDTGTKISITDAYASALANIGVRVQGGKTASTLSSAIAAQAETTRANQAGVNLDEEAAKLIQYQQSYQAAAKILQVAQSVFDTMLQVAAR